jgi:ribosomal-protein-alanine N-acetyltransferase
LNPIEFRFLLRGYEFGGELKRFFIERMDIEDLDEVLSLSPLLPSPWFKNMFLEEMESPFSHCFVMKMKEASRGRVVGFICFRNVADESELLNICVHPRYRQLGIGRKLMQFYAGFCSKKKIKTFYLEVNSANEPAVHLYQLFSYQPSGMRKKFYQGKFDALLMVKKI